MKTYGCLAISLLSMALILVDSRVKTTESNVTATINLGQCHYPARALRALGLLLADGAPTVGRGKTF